MKKNKAIQKFFSGETIWSKIFLVLIFLVSSIFLILPFVFDIDFNTLLTFGIIGLFLINFLGSATIFLPAPAFLSVAVAGSSFNPLLVAIVASAGGALGESIAYLLGYSSTKVLNLKHHTIIYKISKTVMHWKGGILIPFFAFFPNPFFDGLGIIVGMSNYPAKRFILLTFIGRLVRNIGIAYVGLFIW